jgi:hypothetical protein
VTIKIVRSRRIVPADIDLTRNPGEIRKASGSGITTQTPTLAGQKIIHGVMERPKKIHINRGNGNNPLLAPRVHLSDFAKRACKKRTGFPIQDTLNVIAVA